MPTLHLICGMAGAGKTTLARALETETQAIRLCPDEWIQALIGQGADRSEMDRLRDPIERLQWTLAQRLLCQGVSVILENGFWSREERMAYRNTAKNLRVGVMLHFLNVPRSVLWQRIQARNAETPAGGFRLAEAELDEWCSWFTPPDDAEFTQYDRFRVYGKDGKIVTDG